MKYPKIGDNIYHKDVYDYKEKLQVVGIDIDNQKIKLRGDFSGGTHVFDQTDWLNADGWSYVYNYINKKVMRDFAKKIEIRTDPMTQAEIDKNNTLVLAKKYILELTNEIKD